MAFSSLSTAASATRVADPRLMLSLADGELMDWAMDRAPGAIDTGLTPGAAQMLLDAGAMTAIIITEDPPSSAGDVPSQEAAPPVSTTTEPQSEPGHCSSHHRKTCGGKGRRRGTPYPSLEERAKSRSTPPSSVPSSTPPLSLEAGTPVEEPEPVIVKNLVQASEELHNRLSRLRIDALEARLRRKHSQTAQLYEIALAVRKVHSSSSLRGPYGAWELFPRLQDGFSVIEAIEQLARQVLRAEPRYHPDIAAPEGQVLYDYIHDVDIVLALIGACSECPTAYKLLKGAQHRAYQSRVRASSLFESGSYIDEQSGNLASDVPSAREQFIRDLRGRDLLDPLGQLIRLAEALYDLVEQSAERLTHYS